MERDKNGDKLSECSKEQNITVEVNEANTLKMLDYFQQEWVYRHQHFWNLTIKLFTLNIIITMLPFISEAFGITFRVQLFPSMIFPIIGLILAFISCYITEQEATRLSAVGRAKYDIINQMDKLYQYHMFEKKDSKKWMAPTIPKLILVFQVFISIGELLLIYIKNLYFY